MSFLCRLYGPSLIITHLTDKRLPRMKHRTRIFFITAVFFLTSSLLQGKNNIPCVWSGVEKIVAVGDIHGDYQKFIKILIKTGLTDIQLHWTGGKTHLVQLGDVLDRGPRAKMTFDLIKQLEMEAEKAGGKVHLLLGNHEEVNITGNAFQYASYMTVEQFISFLEKDDRLKLEKEFRKGRGEREFRNTDPWLPLTDPKVLEFWTKLMNSQDYQAKYNKSFYNNYGKWLLEHNAVIKINDIIFTHGGISEKFAGYDLTKLNKSIREEMKLVRSIIVEGRMPSNNFSPKYVYVEDSPLWYRDLATRPEDVFKEDVDRILKELGANYMVIGHTTYRKQIEKMEDLSRFDGRIWTIDTGMSARYGGIPTALIIENGEFSLWGLPDEK